jgi:hypothetical protein
VPSLGRSHKKRVKIAFYLGWSHTCSWGLGLLDCLVFTVADDVGAAMAPGIIILATSTHGLHSLGLGAARRVVSYGRSTHSSLVR